MKNVVVVAFIAIVACFAAGSLAASLHGKPQKPGNGANQMTPEQQSIAKNLERALTTKPKTEKQYQDIFNNIIKYASAAFTKLPYDEWVKIYDQDIKLWEPDVAPGSMKLFTYADLPARWQGAQAHPERFPKTEVEWISPFLNGKLVMVASRFAVGEGPIYIGRSTSVFYWSGSRWKAIRGTWMRLSEEKKQQPVYFF